MRDKGNLRTRGPHGLDSIVVGYYRGKELVYVARVATAVIGTKTKNCRIQTCTTRSHSTNEPAPSMVISHTAPSEATAREILKRLKRQLLSQQTRRRGIANVKALQEMLEAHQPSVWCFGHFHINREFLNGGTKFHCLAEMAISQVSEVFSASEGIR